jgi:hypothetical protein
VGDSCGGVRPDERRDSRRCGADDDGVDSLSIVFCGHDSASTTITPTNGYSEVGQTGGKRVEVADQTRSAPTVIGAITFTLSGATRGHTVHVELFSAAAAVSAPVVPVVIPNPRVGPMALRRLLASRIPRFPGGSTLTPVTAAVQAVIDALGGVAQTASDPVNSSQDIATTASDVVDATSGVAATTAEPVEAVAGVASTSVDPVESVRQIAAAVTDPVEATQGVTPAVATEPVEATAGIVSTVSDPVNAGQGIATTASEPVEATQGVASTSGDPIEAQGISSHRRLDDGCASD